MASALLPFVVLSRADGADVARRDGEITSSHESLREALDAALIANGITVGAGVLRDAEGASIGSFRWLDGTAEEAEPIEDGSQVTRDLIARMASMIDPASPVPMDGAEHGAAHSQLYDTSTRADGYVHAGVEVCMPAGSAWVDDLGEEHQGEPKRWHLYIRCELSPVAVRDVDLGLLAYGSIGFDPTSGRLLQHALTNVPAVLGLAPNNAIRSAGRISFRTRRIDMTTPKNVPSASKRGPAMNLIADIAALFKIPLSADTETEDVMDEIRGSLWPLMDAAKVERILEGAPAPATEAAPVAASADTSGASARAIPGLEDPAALETFASEVLNVARDIFGKPEEPPASVLEMLKASATAFKGAIDTAPNPGAAESQQAADAAAMTNTAEPALRSLTSKVGMLEATLAKRDVVDAVKERFRSAGVADLSSEELEVVVSDALQLKGEARARLIDAAVRSRAVPPTGEVFGKRSAPVMVATLREAVEAELPALREKHKGEAEHVIYARAQRVAKAKFPALS